MIKVILESMSYWRKTAGHHVYLTRITRVSDGAQILIQAGGESNVRITLSTLLGWTHPTVYQVESTMTYAQYLEIKGGALPENALACVAFASGPRAYEHWILNPKCIVTENDSGLISMRRFGS